MHGLVGPLTVGGDLDLLRLLLREISTSEISEISEISRPEISEISISEISISTLLGSFGHRSLLTLLPKEGGCPSRRCDRIYRKAPYLM